MRMPFPLSKKLVEKDSSGENQFFRFAIPIRPEEVDVPMFCRILNESYNQITSIIYSYFTIILYIY